MIEILLAFPFDVSATLLAERLIKENMSSNKGRIDWLMIYFCVLKEKYQFKLVSQFFTPTSLHQDHHRQKYKDETECTQPPPS